MTESKTPELLPDEIYVWDAGETDHPEFVQVHGTNSSTYGANAKTKYIRADIAQPVDVKEVREAIDLMRKHVYGDDWITTSTVEKSLETIIRAALSAQQWQDISTAPRDGTHILVTRVPATTRPPINKVRWGKGKLGVARWIISSRLGLQYEPTHWMPLPQPPTNGDK